MIEQRKVDEMSFETKLVMRRVMMCVIDVEEKVESIRANLFKVTTNLRFLFNTIDYLNRGYITDHELSNFISNYPSTEQLYEDVKYNSGEKDNLIMRFNKDKKNGKISLLEFINALTP